MNVELRRCMITDAHAIHELCAQELGYEFDEAHIENNIRRLIGLTSNLLLVAVNSADEVIGFVHASSHDPVYAPPMKSIMAVAIKPEYRQQGLGSRLIEAVEEWAKENGAAGVRVNSAVQMDSALTFYKKRGYQYIKTQYNFRKMF